MCLVLQLSLGHLYGDELQFQTLRTFISNLYLWAKYWPTHVCIWKGVGIQYIAATGWFPSESAVADNPSGDVRLMTLRGIPISALPC